MESFRDTADSWLFVFDSPIVLRFRPKTGSAI